MCTAETSLALEYRAVKLEEGSIRVLRLGDLLGLGNLRLNAEETKVNRVVLTALLLVGKNLHRLGDALEERVVVRLANGAGLLVGVVLENLLAVCMYRLDAFENFLDYKAIRAILICSSVAFQRSFDKPRTA